MMKLQTVKIADLQAHPENYNTHPEEQLLELEKSIDQFMQYKNWETLTGQAATRLSQANTRF